MIVKRPKLNALRTFESAGRHLSFSQAGNELGITQAAVSQQIRTLEQSLGARLFIRRNRGLSLTGVGEAYQQAVHEALDRLDTVTGQLFPDSSSHVVTIQCSPSVATLWLIPRLAQFRSDHPEIQLRIVTLDSEYPESQHPHVDLEITTVKSKSESANEKLLIKVDVLPVCAPQLLEINRIISPKDILNHHLLHVLGYQDDWHRWFRRFGMRKEMVPQGTSFDGSLMALESAVNGGGVMLGRRPFIDHYLESGELVAPFGDDNRLTTRYFLRNYGATRRYKDISVVDAWLTKSL